MLSPIMLVRARYAIPFAGQLTAAGAPTERLLCAAGLDPEVAADPDAVIAQAHLWKFVGLAASAEGHDLGMRAAQAPLHALGSFGLSLLSSTTLRDALHRFCVGAAEEATARFFVAEGYAQAWFCRNRIPGDEAEAAQIEQYLVVLMVNTVSALLGPRWRPRSVRIQARAPSPLSGWAMLGEAQIEYGCNHLAIAIPTALLPARSVGFPPGVIASRRESVASHAGDAPSGLVGLDTLSSIRILLRSAIRHGTPAIDAVADAAGVSTRTFQRQLAAMGSSFSRELSAARFEVAAEAIRAQPHVRLTDLAYDLGYSNPAHLTRAFKRYAGVPPSSFLKAQEQADASLTTARGRRSTGSSKLHFVHRRR